MSLVLDLVYSLAVGGVAAGGVAYVLAGTSDATGRGTTLTRSALVASVALFVGALVWVMAVDPLL